MLAEYDLSGGKGERGMRERKMYERVSERARDRDRESYKLHMTYVSTNLQ